MAGVEVTVRSQLVQIVSDLERIQKSARDVSNSLKDTGVDVGKAVDDQTKKVNNALSGMQQFGRRVSEQLRKDFSSLGSLASLGAGLKLTSQFGGSIKESVALSDTIRKLGSVFGMARGEFVGFQSLLSRGFGDIGASSQAAANAINGLAQTPVRGQANLLAFAKTAAQLASLGGQPGQEGDIAKGMAGVITARGGNANDPRQLSGLTNEILQIRNTTKASITDITASLASLYSSTNPSSKGMLAGGGSTTLATASLMAPGSTQFLEKYMKMDINQREGSNSQGLGNIMGPNGELSMPAIQAAMTRAQAQGRGDAQAGLKTMGFSAEEAQGFIRLFDAMKIGEPIINGAHRAQLNLNDEYRKGMGLGEAFRANINKVKGVFSPVVGAASQGATDLLGSANKSGAGALAVTVGSGILAAVLTGGGLRGIGGILSGEAKATAIESVTGEKVQRVEVVNFPVGLGATSKLPVAAAAIATVAATALALQQAQITSAPTDKAKNKIAEDNDNGAGNHSAQAGQAMAQAFVSWLNRLGANKDLQKTTLPGRGH